MAAIKPKRKNISQHNLEKEILESRKDFIELDIDSIESPQYHDRKFIDKSTIVELADSIKSEGLTYPIIVREKENGRYERIVGFRRLEAFKILGKTKIPSIILKDVSDSQAILMMITENIQRENVSIYDETLALIDYISVGLGASQDEVLKKLRRFKNYNAHNIKDLNSDELREYNEISALLEKTGKISVNTLVDRLAMLNLNKLLIKELSSGRISYTNAKILNKIKDEDVLKKAIDKVLSEGYSKRETVQYVKSLMPKSESENDSIKKLSKINLSKLSNEKQKEVQRLIEKILKITEVE